MNNLKLMIYESEANGSINEETRDELLSVLENASICMEAYNSMYEEIQNRFDNGEITFEEAEFLNDLAYEKYMTEDKSDIDLVNSRKQAEERFRSMKGYSKRPKITKDMSDKDKLLLKFYDHGSEMDNDANVLSTRGAGSTRDNIKQTAADKKFMDNKYNPDTKKYYDASTSKNQPVDSDGYNKDGIHVGLAKKLAGGNRYSGMASSKKRIKK